ncbi:TPA: hypothetical protein DDW35_07940 [Candidatus Sumerlaeota bacterium]|nr:hypothetical protein [Candidatus Sumerlaeota bacterium]
MSQKKHSNIVKKQTVPSAATSPNTKANDADALYRQGMQACDTGRASEAVCYFEQALQLKPNAREIVYGCVWAHQMLGAVDKVIALLRPLTQRNPRDIDAFYLLADAYRASRMFTESAGAYQQALALNPNYAPALNDLGGILLCEFQNYTEARKYYERAVACDPQNPFAINNLGVTFFRTGSFDQAMACYAKALQLKPDYPEPFCNLATIADNQGKFEQSEAYCRQALALRPNFPAVLNNLGNTLRSLGRYQEAIDAYESALRLLPQNPEYEYNLSLALLAAGNFEEGWQLHESRWKTKSFVNNQRYRDSLQSLWRGEAIKGATLFIYCEQGFGDTLQFCRYGTLAARLGLRVVMEVQEPLVRLLQSLEGVEVIAPLGDKRPECDFQSPMLSLPMLFQTRQESIPGEVPYLRVNKRDVQAWKERLQPLTCGKPRIGLVWSGHSWGETIELIGITLRRSMSPHAFEPIANLPGFHFFSLQKGPESHPDFLPLIDLINDCHDFADTAALIENLDLVITVDTAVAHLAGALGKPVWMLNRFDTCWRWQQGSAQTAWYPNMRIFQQNKPGDWGTVVEQVIDALTQTTFPMDAKS